MESNEFKAIKPTLKHVKAMLEVVQESVEGGIILFRSEDEIANTIRSYTLLTSSKGEIAGFVALHIYSLELAEIRSLIVSPSFRGKSLGEKLIKLALKEAKHYNLKEVLVLTYKKALFEFLGFKEVEKSLIPNHKIWADCIKCKRFPACDEIALIKKV